MLVYQQTILNMNSHKVVVYTPLEDFFYNTDAGVVAIQAAVGAIICFLLAVWLNKLLIPWAARSYQKRTKLIDIGSISFGFILFILYCWWIFN